MFGARRHPLRQVVSLLLVGFFLSGCAEPVPPAVEPTVTAVVDADAESRAADQGEQVREFEFGTPLQLTTSEGPISVESPGYACPCWADVDGDGNKDLLVGQFNGGKIQVFKNLSGEVNEELKLDKGEWLLASGEVAQVPGVW